MSIPKQMIERIVNKMHVSTSEAEVIDNIRTRGAKIYSEKEIKEACEYALWVHKRNQDFVFQFRL